jgi:Secretion system C-terminal sorting domain
MRLSHFALFFLLSFFIQSALIAQCVGNMQAEGQTCATSTYQMSAIGACVNCTYNWTPQPVAGQGTDVATYDFGFQGMGNWNICCSQVQIYNPNQNCTFGSSVAMTIGGKPNLAMPVLVNGPWNGDTSKTWIYTRTYIDPSMGNPSVYNYNPSWTVSGGTVVRTAHAFAIPNYRDSVLVKWTGAGPMGISEVCSTYHNGTYGVPFSCNWTPTFAPTPQPGLNIFNGTYCPGSTINFHTFPFSGSTFTWSISNGSVVSGQGSNSAQIQVNGPATVTLVRDSSGTLTTTTKNVTPLALALNLGPDRTICQYTSTTLTASPGFTSYAWSTGATTQSITTSTAGTYSVTASFNGGCITSDTIVVTINPVNKPNLGPNQNLCGGSAVLDAGAGHASYAWSTGATTQTITAPAGGTYRVTVVEPNGCITGDTILVNNQTATITLPANATYCVPPGITLLPTWSNVTSYLWSTGATTSSINVSTIGSSIVTVQGSNAFGCVATASISLLGTARPTPNLGPDQTVCPAASATFNAGPGYLNYAWSNGATTQSMTTATPGTYRVTVTGAMGCTGTDTVQLLNYPFTPPNLGPDIHVCQASATLDAGPGYASYQWSTGATTQSIVVTTGGNYAVTVTAANGCSASDAIVVFFSNLSFSLGNDTTLCQPATLTLDPHLLGPFTYLWSSGATSPTLTLSTPGTVSMSLTASNSFGCTARDTVLVTIFPAAPVIHLGADTVLCADTTIVLDAGAGFASYLWSTNASTAAVTVAQGGVYAITATDANGCTATDTISITGLADCVFPGDVNYDHVADLMDVLVLGNVIGSSGPNRNNASLLWYGQECNNWSGSVLPGVNEKQADTDGNGLVDQNDTLAIYNNFGNVHARIGDISMGNASLRIVPVSSTVSGGSVAAFNVYYEGDGGIDLDSVHGLAFHLMWPTTGLSGPGLVNVDYANAWFAPSGDRMAFTKLGTNVADIALTRTNAIDTSGQGLVMVLRFQTDASIPLGNVVSFAPMVLDAFGIGTDLIQRDVFANIQALNIIGAVGVGNSIDSQVKVWPNPANREIRVRVEGSAAPLRLQLVNLLGQVVHDQPADEQHEFILPVAHLPAGNYFLQVQTEDGLVVRKVVVAH